MKVLPRKRLFTAWVVSGSYSLCLMLALLVSHYFFIPFALLLALYFALCRKTLRCPSCGTVHSLINLTYAMNHPFFCYHCGERIVIEDMDKI